MNFKELIIFDLVLLRLTELSVIAHDSNIFKNIADLPIDKIMELYNQSEKQIFIAFDKEDTFYDVTREPDVQAQLASIREEYKALKPEDILCIDPCSGSGHILAYMFDVLVQIYEAYGVDTRTAVASIVENNIYGLDIDDRAAQLAYFAVMMKARQYDRRFFSRGIQPHVYAIAESNHVDSFALEYFHCTW